VFLCFCVFEFLCFRIFVFSDFCVFFFVFLFWFRYYLFGSPISKSPSPFMQNTAFALCSAPHEYGLCETENIEDVVACLRTSDTGGGSLTMPHKETIMPYIHELTEAATAIGAVNTVTIDATNRFIGDNTDWLGVQNALLEVLTTWSNPRVIVLGAGGTARAVLFAMRRMGCSWLGVYNRTPERAALLAVNWCFCVRS
jgi:pentafunctional AROM polypeptide